MCVRACMCVVAHVRAPVQACVLTHAQLHCVCLHHVLWSSKHVSERPVGARPTLCTQKHLPVRAIAG